MKIVTSESILLCLLVASVIGQDLPDTCRSQNTTLSPEDERLLEELESGQISVSEAREYIILPPPPTFPCEQGPVLVPHLVPFEFHIPTIFKWSCNSLTCRDPPCFAKRRILSWRCVIVYRLINGIWVKLGFLLVQFWEDIECECKTCKHIRSYRECVNTYPCPNSNDTCSYCYWRSIFTPGSGVATPTPLPTVSTISTPLGCCDCCTPTCCPAPQRFNYDRCRCECPRPPPPDGCPPGQIFNDNSCKCEWSGQRCYC